MSLRAERVSSVALLLLLLCAAPASPQSAENVAVVINDDSPASQHVGEYYVERRGIPAANVIHIRTPPAESITRAAYVNTIEGPVAAALGRQNLHDRVLYLVLTKGVPLRITGNAGAIAASVDSELTLLYRKMLGATIPAGGRIANPYYLGRADIASAQRFTHRQYDIFLVTRLDAFTVEEAQALVDRSLAAAAPGDTRFVLDSRGTVLGNPGGDLWLSEAARRLRERGLGDRVVLEGTRAPVRKVQNVLGYYSWGSIDPQNRVRRTDLKFAPGALAANFASSTARTFLEPPSSWMPTGNWQDRSSWFEGAPEWLAGDLIRDGATGVAGYVADPFLQGTLRPEILFPAYVSGFTLAEAFYLALPHLSGHAVIVGDPLCTAFPRERLTQADIEDPVSPDLELPGVFARRRLDVLQSTVGKGFEETLSHLLVAEARLARDDRAGARAALEEAIAKGPSFVPALLQLALMHEQDGNTERAIAHYEQIVKHDPRNVIALNNLAYALAVHRRAPAEARPLARKAATLAPREPRITDTLAWIEHLLGEHETAGRLIATAVRGAPENADVQLHAAFIFAAGKTPDIALRHLEAALSLDADLRKRADVAELEQRLRSKPNSH